MKEKEQLNNDFGTGLLRRIVFLAVLVISVLAFSAAAFADVKIPYPKTVKGSLTGDPAKDILTIAKSQIGYTEAHDSKGQKYTCYSEFCDTNPGSWCSEFTAWCMYEAGLPGMNLSDTFTAKITIDATYYVSENDPSENYTEDDHDLNVARLTYVDAYMNYYTYHTSEGKAYAVSDGNKASSVWVGKFADNVDASNTIKIADIKPGDIVQVTNAKKLEETDTEPEHTALVYKVDSKNKTIYTYDGNGSSQTYRRVVKYSYPANCVFAVIRPNYAKYKRTLSTSAACRHRYVGTETSKGNCLTLNTVKYTCIYCKKSYIRHEVYGDHNYKTNITSQPSKNSCGMATYTCSYCGNSYSKKYYAPAFTISGVKYSTTSSKYVTVTGSSSKKITKLLIPKTVKYNGKTYKVNLIADNAFKNYSKLKKITLKADLKKIGNKAFYGCKKLSLFYTTSTTVPVMGQKCFSKISSNISFKVPKAAYAGYKVLVNRYRMLSKVKLVQF